MRGAQESLAGRAQTISLEGFSRDELSGGEADFASFAWSLPTARAPRDRPGLTRRDYLDLVTTPAFPEIVDRTTRQRERWLASYTERVLSKDSSDITGIQHPDRLEPLLNMIAARNTGEFVAARVGRELVELQSDRVSWNSINVALCGTPSDDHAIQGRVCGRDLSRLVHGSDDGRVRTCRLAGLDTVPMRDIDQWKPRAGLYRPVQADVAESRNRPHEGDAFDPLLDEFIDLLVENLDGIDEGDTFGVRTPGSAGPHGRAAFVLENFFGEPRGLGPEEPFDQPQAEVDTGGDARRGDHIPIIYDTTADHDRTSTPKMVFGHVVRRTRSPVGESSCRQQQCAGARGRKNQTGTAGFGQRAGQHRTVDLLLDGRAFAVPSAGHHDQVGGFRGPRRSDGDLQARGSGDHTGIVDGDEAVPNIADDAEGCDGAGEVLILHPVVEHCVYAKGHRIPSR